MDLIWLGNILLHIPWIKALLLRLGLISEGLHDLFCDRGCELSELAW